MDTRLLMDRNLAKFTINGILNTGDIVNNTIYLERSCCSAGCGDLSEPEWSDSRAESSALDVLSHWNGDVVATVLSQDYSTVSCTWSWNEAVPGGPVHTGTVPDPSFHGGGVGSTAMAAGCAKALRLQTGLAGRSFRGRLFLPAVPDVFGTTDKKDLLTGTAITAYNTAGAALFGHLNTNSCLLDVGVVVTWVVASFVHSHAQRSSALTTAISAANISDSFVDYQRRRSLGHQRHG